MTVLMIVMLITMHFMNCYRDGDHVQEYEHDDDRYRTPCVVWVKVCAICGEARFSVSIHRICEEMVHMICWV